MVNGQIKMISLSNSSNTITSMCWEPLSVTHILSSHGTLPWNQCFCFPGLSPTILSIHLKKNGVLLLSWSFFMRKNRRQAGTGHEAGFTLRSVSTITILIIKSKCQEKRIIDWHVHAFQSWVLCASIHFQPVKPSVHLRQLQGLSALLLDGKQSFSPQELKKGARFVCSSPKLDYVPKLYS